MLINLLCMLHRSKCWNSVVDCSDTIVDNYAVGRSDKNDDDPVVFHLYVVKIETLQILL